MQRETKAPNNPFDPNFFKPTDATPIAGNGAASSYSTFDVETSRTPKKSTHPTEAATGTKTWGESLTTAILTVESWNPFAPSKAETTAGNINISAGQGVAANREPTYAKGTKLDLEFLTELEKEIVKVKQKKGVTDGYKEIGESKSTQAEDKDLSEVALESKSISKFDEGIAAANREREVMALEAAKTFKINPAIGFLYSIANFDPLASFRCTTNPTNRPLGKDMKPNLLFFVSQRNADLRIEGLLKEHRVTHEELITHLKRKNGKTF